MITRFNLVTETTIPFYIKIEDVIEEIKSDKYKDVINKILLSTEKEDIKRLKMSLPLVCFNGKFSKKGDDYFISSSGFICLDFDKIPDSDFESIKNELKTWPYTYILFTTPSGKGLKVIVKVPEFTKNEYYLYWNSLQDNFYDSDYFDQNVKGLSHGHFLTHDPNLIINEDSLIWTKKKEITYNSIKEEVFFPIEDEKKKIDFIENCFDELFIDGNRNNYCYKKAKFFNKLGISRDTCYNHLLSICNTTKDFTLSELEVCIKQGYSNKEKFGTYLLEDKEKQSKVLSIKGKFLKPSELKKFCDENDTDITKVNSLFDKIDTRVDKGIFWELDKNGNVKHSPLEYRIYLERLGFRKVKRNIDEYIFVKVNENIISLADIGEIKDIVLTHVREIDNNNTYKFYANNPKYFKEDHINQIDTIKPVIKKDTKDLGYIYFKNKVLEVSKDNVNETNYNNIESYIWHDQILNYEFDFNYSEGIFENFVKKISGNDFNFEGICSSIGYLMHSYKAPSITKMIIYTDKTTDSDPQGRTGKSLLGQAIKRVKNTVRLDGKNWKQDSQFLFSGITESTQVFFVDDALKTFDFEKMFSVITSDMQVEKKGVDPITINFEDSPKFVTSSNYVMGGTSDSYKDRKAEYEIERYFNADFKPLNLYGREFWQSDFTKEDWDQFYTFMIKCLQKYLKDGLIVPQAETVSLRAFYATTKNETLSNYLQMRLKNAYNMHLGVKGLTMEYNNWVNSDGNSAKEMIVEKTMALAIRAYCSYIGAKYKTGLTNGLTWIEIIKQ